MESCPGVFIKGLQRYYGEMLSFYHLMKVLHI